MTLVEADPVGGLTPLFSAAGNGYRRAMFASILPGLREVRTPLAAGYVWLVGTWLLLAPVLPSREDATGIVLDAYSMLDALGTATALVAASFLAYLVGVLSVALMSGFTRLGDRIGINRLVWIGAGKHSETSRMRVIETALLRRFYARLTTDKSFQETIQTRLSKIQGRAEELRRPLPAPLASLLPIDLGDEARSRPYTTSRILARTIDLQQHARELMWDSLFVDDAVPTSTDLVENRDRARAEGLLKFNLVLPLLFLTGVLTYRVSWWCMALTVVPLWFLYLGDGQHSKASTEVLNAIAAGRLEWPALDSATKAKVIFRRLDEIFDPRG